MQKPGKVHGWVVSVAARLCFSRFLGVFHKYYSFVGVGVGVGSVWVSFVVVVVVLVDWFLVRQGLFNV